MVQSYSRHPILLFDSLLEEDIIYKEDMIRQILKRTSHEKKWITTRHKTRK